MSRLKFVVIPSKNDYEEYSENVVSRIKEVNNCSAELDTNYRESLKMRIDKYKKNNKNIITIGLSEIEHDTIMIHFIGSRPKTMECDEFITLLESYDDEDEDEENSVDNSSSSSESSDEDVGNMFQKQSSNKKIINETKTKTKAKTKTKNTNEDKDEDEGDAEGEDDACIIC